MKHTPPLLLAVKISIPADKVAAELYRTEVGDKLVRFGLKSLGIENAFTLKRTRTEFGKRIFPDLRDLDFSISHSANWVVAALHHKRVGVDIEKIVPTFDLQIAETFCTEAEIKRLSSLSDKAMVLRMLFRIWTLKEAYVKAMGLGLHGSLLGFEILFSKSIPELLRHDMALPNMTLAEWDLDDNYACSLCCESAWLKPDVWKINLGRILSYCQQ